MKISKKNIVAFALMIAFLMTPSVFHAQIKFGIRAGLNVSNVSFEKLPNKSERFGYHVGVFADVPIVTDFLSIQPELSYSVKGAAFKPLTDRQTLNMNYVDFVLPVAFKLTIFDLQVGPFASYLISSPDYAVYNETKVITDAYKTIDVGLTAGISVNINKLMVGIRYNQGFVAVTKDSSKPYLGDGKNAVGQVSLGYKF
jgi:Outer membrane protein beta-barrel domain